MSGKGSSDKFQDSAKLSVSKQLAARQSKNRIIDASADVSQIEKELSQKALADFNNGNYSHAVFTLNKLEKSRQSDIKVLHNKAVCDYYKGGLVNTDAFKKRLIDIIIQSSNGKSGVPEWPGSVESSVVVLNLAVLHFHQEQCVQAVELLTPLYAALDSLEESVGISVCLLLASCYLACSRPDNALSVLCHTEATFLPQPLPASQQPPTSPSHPPQQHGSVRSASAGSAVPATVLGEPPPPSTAVSAGAVREDSAGQEALRRRVQLLRVRALMALKILKPAAREFKSTLVQAASAGHDLELKQICIKSQLKLLRSQHLKALKVLNTCIAIPPSVQHGSTARREGPSLDVWYYNNLSIIHLGLSKPTLALVYLEKAVDQHILDMNEKDTGSPHLYSTTARIHAALVYNLASIFLRLNKSIEMARRAFALLIESAQANSTNPRLWLQLAQCCIAVHKWELTGSEHGRDKSLEVNIRTLGKGATAKLLLCPNYSQSKVNRLSDGTTDTATPQPRLAFGRLCGHNALKLLPGPDAVEQEGACPPSVYPCPPSLPMRLADAARVRSAVLACAAYTALALGRHQEALDHAVRLLAVLPQDPAAHAAYRFLGNVYASECCVMLNRRDEALKYLDLEEMKEHSTQATTGRDYDDWSLFSAGGCPRTPQDQLTVLKFNLSIVYALREDYDKSASLLNDVWCAQPQGKPTPVVMLAVYLQLRRGNVEKARLLVCDHLKKV